MSSIRVRFAPSPTGPLHIGGLRTALYNYLFARKQGGVFIVRIEDTDRSRFVAGAEAYLFEALKWCGIEPDESPLAGGRFGPYRQSERRALYADYAQQLVASGHAYYAFDTQEALAALREGAAAKGSTFVYNAENRGDLCNSLSLDAATAAAYRETRPYVIRFKTPENRSILTRDRIRGQSKIDSRGLDDKILYKSDGMPTYHLANVVDDHAMAISHVIRGEEWLPSLALHQLLYEALGWEAPEFAHLPLLLKPAGKGKLSKRDGDRGGFPVFPLAWCDPQSGVETAGYRERGYTAEALVNTLALLGWNPGTDQECFSLAELESVFSLDRVSKSGARFDPDKAVWFNHQYLQKRPVATLARELDVLLQEKQLKKPLPFLEQVVALNRARVNFVKDFLEAEPYFFERPEAYERRAARKLLKPDAVPLLAGLKARLEGATSFEREALTEGTKDWIASQGWPLGKALQLLRLSLAGALQGPDVFAIAALLGKGECVARLEAAQGFAAQAQRADH